MRCRGWLLLALLTTRATAGAENLVENPTFDTGIAGWVAAGSSKIEWSPNDELGSPGSGSIRIDRAVPASFGVGAFQCIPVTAGTTYAIGADARIPAGQDLVQPHARVLLNWSTAVGCTATSSGLPQLGRVEIEGAWGNSQGWATAPPGAVAAEVVLVAESTTGVTDTFVVEFDNVFFTADSTCGTTPTALCLTQGRFRVEVEWETLEGDAGYGHAVPLTGDSGYFWFFNDDNVELVTKLLDACPTQFNRFWFFAAGLTNVETTIRVTDTGSNTERVYVNPQQTPFAPIQDTDAFNTCPMIGG